MKSDQALADVAIIGGGFSGTMVAAQAVRRGLKVVLIEGGGRAGQGTAYSTRDAVHLLNVPAAKMSAWSDRPADLVETGFEAGEFIPRRDYGRYLQHILTAAIADGLTLFETRAAAARRNGNWLLNLDNGDQVRARTVVLAHGNQPPLPLSVSEGIDSSRFVNNPWGAEARAAIERCVRERGDVLVLGTGLTMVDMVLSLCAAGFQGRIIAVSRRGQVPHAHAAHEPVVVDRDEVPKGICALFDWMREQSARFGWRGVVDALRPHAQSVWRSLEQDEQERFLRHARPYWDVHRHRIAPQVAAQLSGRINTGRLEIVAGRLRAVRDKGAAIEVEIARRGDAGPPVIERVGAVFNCTGPLGAIGRTSDPLLRQMLDEGLIAVDHLGIGMAVDAGSKAGERLWALGPLTKGAFWEIVAVPDIRGQVASVADAIAEELAR